MDILGNFALGTVTTFLSSKITGYVLVAISRNERVREFKTMTSIIFFSIGVGLVIGLVQGTTASSRHRNKILKKVKKFKKD